MVQNVALRGARLNVEPWRVKDEGGKGKGDTLYKANDNIPLVKLSGLTCGIGICQTAHRQDTRHINDPYLGIRPVVRAWVTL